ncbi:L-arabinose isomerase [Clostridium omnivorum]|uniref:L-arabinose isomerase n=1 Tax=Clostridium omnivorum TaxID=1604902 RepID=A0ABQ5N1Z9_9CLOT|nr:L-arabinose isomerase [Clostridium sp. E14]GLC29228.1 L-arabinose isomerase [Clostridium sp. E14]
MNRLYFITGSQDLYGKETLDQVAEDSKNIALYLNQCLSDTAEIVWQPTVRNSEEIVDVCQKATVDKDCIGVITWMHTFSPAKMWIKGLQLLTKPLLHLHTQYNEKLPYDTIDMDFMNLNQSAHGDREFGFILSRLGIKHEVVAGYYKHKSTISEIQRFAQVAKAMAFSKNLKAAMFGNNMREVAVTDGDRVESQIKYGWEVNYYGIGELVALTDAVTEAEVAKKLHEYKLLYNMSEKDTESVKVQARYEIALDKFLDNNGIVAFTDTFQDLYGLKQLPGIAVQRQMARGIGFGAEGDYKTACLTSVMHKMAEGRKGATGFMEDYTYDLTEGQELVLAAHMLEVSPEFAATKPQIEVHPLGIGGKEPPARLVFEGVKGDAVAVCMTDMGDRFRLICAEIELVSQTKPMPKLPVARLMWKLKPDFKSGVKAWLEAGGGHHTVVSTALTSEDIAMFAKLTDTEFILIR